MNKIIIIFILIISSILLIYYLLNKTPEQCKSVFKLADDMPRFSRALSWEIKKITPTLDNSNCSVTISFTSSENRDQVFNTFTKELNNQGWRDTETQSFVDVNGKELPGKYKLYRMGKFGAQLDSEHLQSGVYTLDLHELKNLE